MYWERVFLWVLAFGTIITFIVLGLMLVFRTQRQRTKKSLPSILSVPRSRQLRSPKRMPKCRNTTSSGAQNLSQNINP